MSTAANIDDGELQFLFGNGVKKKKRAMTLSLKDYICDTTPSVDFLKVLHGGLTKHVDQLTAGLLKLALTPEWLSYLSDQLYQALIPKRNISNAIVDWSLNYNTSVGPEIAEIVLELGRFLPHIRHVYLYDNQPSFTCDLAIFSGLRILELNNVSMDNLESFECFQDQLQALLYTRMDLSPNKIVPKGSWTMLRTLKAQKCNLQRMDESLGTIPHVESIDLSNNRIHRIEHLEHCAKLEVLNLGFNRIDSFLGMKKSLGNVTVLNLRYNSIVSMEGVEELTSLQSLDLSHNRIESLFHLELLRQSVQLKKIVLSGNPVSYIPDYRRQVLFQLGTTIELDGTPWSRTELAFPMQRKARPMEYPKLTPTKKSMKAKLVNIEPDEPLNVGSKAPVIDSSPDSSPERVIATPTQSTECTYVYALHTEDSDGDEAILDNIETGGIRRLIRLEGHSIHESDDIDSSNRAIAYDLHFLISMSIAQESQQPRIIKLELRGNRILGYRFKNVIELGATLGDLQQVLHSIFGKNLESYRCLECQSLIHRIPSEQLVMECPICVSKNIRPIARHEMKSLFEDKGITTPYLRRSDTYEFNLRNHLGFHLDDRTHSSSSSLAEESVVIVGSSSFQNLKAKEDDSVQANDTAHALNI